MSESPADDPVIALLIEGALDLGRVRQHVRLFLAGVEEPAVADAVLVTVMLAGDAYRFGDPPITLRLRLLDSGARLRIEIDHDPANRSGSRMGSRTRILNRITTARGQERQGAHMITWAELPLRVGTEMLEAHPRVV
ncbi:hypothetical protein [Actinophytocola sp.]|uniref:hypothetical protein n=1 Tax=Actinophytocola sp. TaxID=1872138 RepID=UPI002D7EF5DF|nr:hypothetical protein [Actinophytocola sp.]HET9141502.1 hypothetical protein [Actinophytocola sp.]